MNDSFYIGYHQRTDRATARRIVLASSILLVLFVGSAFTWLNTLTDAADGFYEFGTVREWTGLLTSDPYPTLVTRDESGETKEVLLVTSFKEGTETIGSLYSGQMVKLSGTKIQRGGVIMVELDDAPIRPLSDVELLPVPDSPEARRVTVKGRFVDSKCWLGVMNPGEGIVHRACARLCIRGGIPPALIFEDENGQQVIALVAGPDGEPLREDILPHVALPVQVTGSYTPSYKGRLARLELDRMPE